MQKKSTVYQRLPDPVEIRTDERDIWNDRWIGWLVSLVDIQSEKSQNWLLKLFRFQKFAIVMCNISYDALKRENLSVMRNVVHSVGCLFARKRKFFLRKLYICCICYVRWIFFILMVVVLNLLYTYVIITQFPFEGGVTLSDIDLFI